MEELKDDLFVNLSIIDFHLELDYSVADLVGEEELLLLFGGGVDCALRFPYSVHYNFLPILCLINTKRNYPSLYSNHPF